MKILSELRALLLPKKGYSRVFKTFFLKAMRLKTSTHKIALGLAVGVFVSITPLLGLHFIMAGVIGFLLRASLPASMIGTFFGNPLTWPFLWLGAFQAGNLFLDSHLTLSDAVDLFQDLLFKSELGFSDRLDLLWVVVQPMTIGLFVFGIPFSALCYAIFYKIIDKLKQRYYPNKTNQA